MKVWIAAPIFLAVACHRPVYHLSFQPKADTTYQYQVSEQTSMLATEKGDRVTSHHNLFFAYHYTKDTKGIHLNYDDFGLHIQSPEKEWNLDAVTSMESGDPGTRLLSAYAGADMDLEMDSLGKITGLPGFERIATKMNLINPDKDQAANWSGRFNEDYFKRLLEKSLRFYPPTDVQVGSSWNGVDSLNADPRIQIPVRFTLLKNVLGVLFIEEESEVDVTTREISSGNRWGQLSLKGRQHGVIQVNALTGAVIQGHTILQAKGVLHTGNVDIPMIVGSNYDVNSLPV
jgi:hypothetical protein